MLKQVMFVDLENDQKHLGILLENGDVLCCCCGGIQEAEDRGVTWELVSEYQEWKPMSINSEKTIRVFLWDGLIDDVRSSDPEDQIKVELFNADSDYDSKEKYKEFFEDNDFHSVEWVSRTKEMEE